MNNKISIIIVTYNSARDIVACLTSVEKMLRDVTHEIIVVDNASTDATVELVKQHFPGVQLIVNAENVGFAVGVNVGAKVAQGDVLLFLNPDAEIVQWKNAVLARFLQSRCGILGGALRSFNGDIQGSAGFEPNGFTELVHAFRLQYILPVGRYVVNPKFYARPRAVDWVSGGFMLVKQSVWKALGGFDERFFLYMEDVDLCVRARQRGYGVYLDPAIQVRHRLMGSSGSASAAHAFYFPSLRAYFEKHRPKDVLARLFIRLLEVTS